jgi:hypothetical protein
MSISLPRTARNMFTALLLLTPLCASAQKSKHAQKPIPRTVWNYDGGLFLISDGGIPDGPCFRITGSVTTPRFFDNLKRIDDDSGTFFRRGAEAVTHYPDDVLLSFAIRDQLCPAGLLQVGTRPYLTHEMMRTLRLSLYWKHGVDLRPISHIAEVRSWVEPIVPYAKNLASELPKRYEWSNELAIPSAGVPLTDSLVLVFRTPDGRIAARVAARM